jgi:hypothetical protein
MATVLTRWFAPVVLAAGLGAAAMTPTPARADDWARVIVDVADVIYHGGYPYYRYDRGYTERLIVVHDRGRPNYYRRVYRAGPPYGNAYGYWNAPRGNCNKHGKCVTRYYDGRYDRHYYDHRRDRAYYQDRRWDDRRYDRDDHRDRYDRDDRRRWRDD